MRTSLLRALGFAASLNVGCFSEAQHPVTAAVVTAFRAPNSKTRGSFAFRTQNWRPTSDVFEIQKGELLTELQGVEIRCLNVRCVSESKQQVRFVPNVDGTLPTQVELQFQKPGFETLKVTATLQGGALPLVVILEPKSTE